MATLLSCDSDPPFQRHSSVPLRRAGTGVVTTAQAGYHQTGKPAALRDGSHTPFAAKSPAMSPARKAGAGKKSDMKATNGAEAHSAGTELKSSEAEERASLEWWRECRRRRHEHDGAVAWYEACAPQQGLSQYWGRL